jgi:hypothetical protein
VDLYCNLGVLINMNNDYPFGCTIESTQKKLRGRVIALSEFYKKKAKDH